MFPFIRIFIGVIFIVSGFEKAISPYQNFVYIIQAYHFFPGWSEVLVARLFPWVELLVGAFLACGLWTKNALLASIVLSAAFILIVGQALLRGLPIDQCGCFGELIHVPPTTIIVFDSGLLLLAYWSLRRLEKSSLFGLDRYFTK